MSDKDELKCSECIRRRKPCVSVSWESLDKTRDKLRSELSVEEAQREALLTQLSEMTARIARKRKVLEQAQQRVAKKFECLVDEMEADGEDMRATVIDASSLQAELFPDGWPDPQLPSGGGEPLTVEASSSHDSQS